MDESRGRIFVQPLKHGDCGQLGTAYDKQVKSVAKTRAGAQHAHASEGREAVRLARNIIAPSVSTVLYSTPKEGCLPHESRPCVLQVISGNMFDRSLCCLHIESSFLPSSIKKYPVSVLIIYHCLKKYFFLWSKTTV